MARRHSLQVAPISSDDYEYPKRLPRRSSMKIHLRYTEGGGCTEHPPTRMCRRLSFGSNETAEFRTSEPSNELYLQRSRWADDTPIETMEPPRRARSGEGGNCGGGNCDRDGENCGSETPVRMPRRERRL